MSVAACSHAGQANNGHVKGMERLERRSITASSTSNSFDMQGQIGGTNHIETVPGQLYCIRGEEILHFDADNKIFERIHLSSLPSESVRLRCIAPEVLVLFMEDKTVIVNIFSGKVQEISVKLDHISFLGDNYLYFYKGTAYTDLSSLSPDSLQNPLGTYLENDTLIAWNEGSKVFWYDKTSGDRGGVETSMSALRGVYPLSKERLIIFADKTHLFKTSDNTIDSDFFTESDEESRAVVAAPVWLNDTIFVLPLEDGQIGVWHSDLGFVDALPNSFGNGQAIQISSDGVKLSIVCSENNSISLIQVELSLFLAEIAPLVPTVTYDSSGFAYDPASIAHLASEGKQHEVFARIQSEKPSEEQLQDILTSSLLAGHLDLSRQLLLLVGGEISKATVESFILNRQIVPTLSLIAQHANLSNDDWGVLLDDRQNPVCMKLRKLIFKVNLVPTTNLAIFVHKTPPPGTKVFFCQPSRSALGSGRHGSQSPPVIG